MTKEQAAVIEAAKAWNEQPNSVENHIDLRNAVERLAEPAQPALSPDELAWLEEAERHAAMATSGPWTRKLFIAAARTDVPKLIALIRRLAGNTKGE